MLNNKNKVKKPLRFFYFVLYLLYVLKIEGCVERIVFIVSMLMDYELVKRGINIGRIVAVH
ncbi:hypothetical protein DN390_10790 [Bacillus sp. SH7-1]|nr:hypothetical protein DN390_10790 [Bacillus sp. SH7-1]